MTSALAVLGGVERRLALVTTVAEAKAIRDEASPTFCRASVASSI